MHVSMDACHTIPGFKKIYLKNYFHTLKAYTKKKGLDIKTYPNIRPFVIIIRQKIN